MGIVADFEATILMGLQVNWQWKIEDCFFREFQDFFLAKNHKCAALTCCPNCVWDHFVHYETHDARYTHSGPSGEVSGCVKVGHF